MNRSAYPPTRKSDDHSLPVNRKSVLQGEISALNHYPTTVKIRPTLVLCAKKLKLSGGYRLWLLARNLDANGQGSVVRQEVFEYAKYLGLSRKQFYRWLKQAIEAGFVEEKKRKSSGLEVIVLRSEAKVAIKVGLGRVDKYLTVVDARTLVKPKWMHVVWQHYITLNYNGKMISRSTLAAITGVERHQQSRYERDAGLEKTKNYVKTEKDGNLAPGMREHGLTSAFSHQGYLYYRIPDTRFGIDVIKAGRGSSTKINKILKQRQSTASENKGVAGSNVDEVYRLFFVDSKRLNNYLRALGSRDLYIPVVFLSTNEKTRRLNNIWQEVCWNDHS